MKNLFTFLLLLFSTHSFSQCDSTLMSKHGTYQVYVIDEAVDYVGLHPRNLTCEELIYIESLRDYVKVFVKLDDYTKVEIFPKNLLYYEK